LPIGLPSAYAANRPETDFLTFLRGLGGMPDFFRVCASLNDIEPGRPFYSACGVAGMPRLSHAHALGMADVHRLCRGLAIAPPRSGRQGHCCSGLWIVSLGVV